MKQKPLIGISSCLLGQKVRYDGQHKRDDFLTKTLGLFVEWVPVCPEVDVGMGVPRESIRLVEAAGRLQLVGERSGRDWTEAMQTYASQRVSELLKMGINGYVLKKDSPSCGLERVRIYPVAGKAPRRDGQGMFAQVLMDASAMLPVEEEGRLNDPKLRENFIERVFAYQRWQLFLEEKPSAGKLVAFHTSHKLGLMAHSEKHLRLLGRLVAQGKSRPFNAVLEEYGRIFMETLRVPATRKKNTNVLHHALGYFSDRLSSEGRREMLDLIRDYHQGLVPLVVPVTLMKHYINMYEIPYLVDQYYFHPHPKELMLRNHV